MFPLKSDGVEGVWLNEIVELVLIIRALLVPSSLGSK